MRPKSFAALLLACLLFASDASAALILPYDGPINRRVDRNMATTLANQPEAARMRTDTLVIGVQDLWGEPSPFFAQTSGDGQLASLLFDELVFADNDGNFGAGIADFSQSADGLTYTFSIQKNVAYADGTALSSDDMINALYLLAIPGFDGAYDIRVAGIEGIEAYQSGEAADISGITRIDDASFSVTLRTANPSALYGLSVPALRVSAVGDMKRPASLHADEHAAFYKSALESARSANPGQTAYGQYFLSSITPGEKAVLIKNEGYWRGAPIISNIELLVVPIGDELDFAMEGTVDIISMLGSVEAIDTVSAYMSFINLYTWKGDVVAYIGMNLDHPLLSDYTIRKALALGIDRDTARKNRIERFGNTPTTLLFDSFSPSSAESMPEQFARDQDAAVALLEEAGWLLGEDGIRYRDGVPLSLTFSYNEPNPITDVYIPQLLFDFMGLGIGLEFESLSFEELRRRIDSGDVELYFEARRLPTSAWAATNFFAGDSHLNQSGYQSEMLLRLLAMAESENDPARQNVILELFYQQLYMELPFLPLYRRSEFLLVNARVMNLTITTSHDLLSDAYRLFFTDTLEGQW